MSRLARVGAVALLASLTVVGLAGCGNSTSPVTDYSGEPKGVPAPPSSAGGSAFSVWLKGGDQFTVTLYGSSTCPPVATGFSLRGKNLMTVEVKKHGDKACTMDYVPHTTVFSTPNTIDRNRDVKITAAGQSFVLEALPKK